MNDLQQPLNEGALNNSQENIVLTEGTQDKDITSQEPKSDVIAKTFTQEQVNKIMRNRVERNRQAMLNRYDVKDRDGLDALIGKSQSYDIMKERYQGLKDENSSLKERLAFISNGINPDREDDIRAYFKGKDLAFNEEALIKELETHPEWRKIVEEDTTPKTTIKALGVEHRDRNVPENEAEKQKRIFGV